jgi:molybdate transport system substrate-binding protein
MKLFLNLIIILTLSFTISAKEKDRILVAAAANLSGVIRELKESYEKENPGIEIMVVLGSSGKISSQIIAGAEYDIFMSADMNFAEQLYLKGFAVSKPDIYAVGKLILFAKNNIDLSKGLTILKDKKIEHIAIANPKLAPYGKAAMEVIENYKLKNIEPKLVYAENISQAAEQALVAADAAFLSKSLLYTEQLKSYNAEGKFWIQVDTTLYNPIKQGMIILKKTKVISKAKKFYKYIMSASEHKIFLKYGYE